MIKKFILFSFMYFIFIFSINAYTAYNQGDVVNYNEIDFYVLYDSDENSNVLTLLKAEPLSVDEVNTYGVGHINKYPIDGQHNVIDKSGYGGIVYYSSQQCGFVNGENIFSDCKNDYESSDIKYVIDSWSKANLNEKDLWKDGLGYSYRLITKEEILEYMNYSLDSEYNFSYLPIKGKTPDWLYDLKYSYWTMTDINKINSYGNEVIGIYTISSDGILAAYSDIPCVGSSVVRPIVLLKKSALNKKTNGSNSNSSNNSGNKSNTSNTNNTSNYINVSVPDTFTKVSILSITIGIILVGTCVTIYVYIKKRNK